MIKVEDLRVGNYLLDEHGEIFQVKQIGTGLIESYGMYIYEIEEIKPIELTEEILLKCGFVRDGNTDYYTCRKVGFTINLSGTIGYRTCIWSNEHIKYLHQLQNLYWCLCNQELKINL